MMNKNRIQRIEQKLREKLSIISLEIIDDSNHHIGHAGAKNGGGHYTVKVCSGDFVGKSLLQRHRMIYSILNSMLESEIHALSIETSVPNKEESEE